MNRRSALTVCAAATLGLATLATTGLAAGAAASGAHAVTTASKSNYSSAVERPTWNFSCNSSPKTFTFTINNVQVIDASGKPWNHNNGPWNVTFWAATQAGPVPFSRFANLHQDTTNGLFAGKGAQQPFVSTRLVGRRDLAPCHSRAIFGEYSPATATSKLRIQHLTMADETQIVVVPAHRCGSSPRASGMSGLPDHRHPTTPQPSNCSKTGPEAHISQGIPAFCGGRGIQTHEDASAP